MSLQSDLREKLALPEYSAMDDEQRLAALNVRDIPARVPIETRNIEMYLESVDKLYTIRTHTSDEAKGVVMIFDRFEYFDMSNAYDDAVLNTRLASMVTFSIITQAEMDLIIGLGDILITIAEEIGFFDINIQDVSDAR